MAVNPRILTLLVASLFALPLGASAAPAYTVTPVVNWWNTSDAGGAAYHMNNAGQTAGWYSSHGPDWEAATYSNGAVTLLRPAGYGFGVAFGINDSGTVLAKFCKGLGSCVNATVAGGVTTELSADIKYSDTWYGTSPINNRGQITGAVRDGTNEYAFLYTPGSGAIDLGFGGVYSWGNAVNDAGSVAGWYQGADYIRHAVLYSGGAVQELAADAWYSDANDLNNAGVAVGYAAPSDGEGYAVMFVNGKVIELGDRSVWGIGTANAINNAGTVVGNADLRGFGMSSFVYKDGAMYDLNKLVAPGWTVGGAWDVNDSGQILVDGIDPDGALQIMLLTPTNLSPVPEPEQYVALIAGLLVVGATLRCRHPSPGFSA